MSAIRSGGFKPIILFYEASELLSVLSDMSISENAPNIGGSGVKHRSCLEIPCTVF